ncbi:MAG TPA: outer membrane beta-barrel protein [Candidatus Polarisedimenticolaceae bacterium]|nr:outer membrane beta-barrel protein [Candidatus Polarisedimenticolaceae bacterium]
MIRPARPRRRRFPWRATGALAILAGAPTFAQEVPTLPPPSGVRIGPVVVAPSLLAGYSYDSNIFLRSETENPPADNVLMIQPAVVVTVPFSNSVFRFGDSLRWIDYKETAQTSGKYSNDALAEMDLRFGSLDTLELSAHHIAGIADTIVFDPGGETVFRGNAFRAHKLRGAFSRDVDGARGYRISIERNAVKFDRSAEIQFFDYTGFDFEAGYLEPLSSNTHLGIGYLGTRYDHFDIGPGADPHAVFRTETGDTAFFTLDGRLGPRSPYRVRLGWEWLRFDGNDAEDYSGVVVDTDVAYSVGGRTTFGFGVQRQPYRSFFLDNNFYVYDEISARVERGMVASARFGASVAYWRNDYHEPVPSGFVGEGIERSDRAISLEVYATLPLRDLVGIRLSVRENRKTSNYPGADYNETMVTGGFVFGWF